MEHLRVIKAPISKDRRLKNSQRKTWTSLWIKALATHWTKMVTILDTCYNKNRAMCTRISWTNQGTFKMNLIKDTTRLSWLRTLTTLQVIRRHPIMCCQWWARVEATMHPLDSIRTQVSFISTRSFQVCRSLLLLSLCLGLVSMIRGVKILVTWRSSSGLVLLFEKTLMKIKSLELLCQKRKVMAW